MDSTELSIPIAVLDGALIASRLSGCETGWVTVIPTDGYEGFVGFANVREDGSYELIPSKVDPANLISR